jgi:hypothetical protein
MPAPSLSTPAARIEVRDHATYAWHEWAEIGATDGPSCNRTEAARVASVAGAIRDLGFLTAVDLRYGAASFASITVTACDGSSIVLDWEPCAEGFEYEGSGDDACDLGEEEAQHEAEPEPEPADGKAKCEDCGQRFPRCSVHTVEDEEEDGGTALVSVCEDCLTGATPEPEPKPKTIDITPTWASLIGLLACAIERGGESRRTAIAELTRLAEFADAVNARNRK